MKKQEKQMLIESLIEAVQGLPQERKLWYVHGYLSVHLEMYKDITYKDYYDIIRLIVDYKI